jgi:hypothetical protein
MKIASVVPPPRKDVSFKQHQWGEVKPTTMKRLLTLLFSLAIVITVHAQVPGTLSYQGILVNSSGEPVNDGVHSVQFKFYDALTGGALVDDTAPIIVTTYKGLFTTTIGSGETGNEALTSDVMNAAYLGNKAIFVEIVADGTTLSPRVRLTSTINAFHAHNANNATNASTMPASGLTGSANLPNTVLDIDLQDLADGVLSVERGGTGATAITGVFIGNGTGAATGVAATGAGQFFRRNAADTGYEFVDLSASNGLTVNDGNLSLGGTLTENTTLSTDGFNMEINGLGKVGIGTGTNDPLNKLDVGGSMSVGNGYAGIETAPTNSLIVQGNVGIGTASPTQRLDVRGSSSDDGGVISIGNVDNSHFLSLFSGRESDALPYVAWAPSDPLRFVTYNSADFTGFAEHMRISASGSVGMGTTTPANRLDVEGAAAIGTGYSGSSTAPANGAIIEGSVGIGTAAPSSKLDVRGQLTLDADNSWVTGGVRFRNSSNVLDGGVIQTLSGALFYRSPSGDGQLGHRFYNGGSASEIMTLLNNGNLGIGTTTPAARLDVNGTSVFRGYTGINRTTAIGSSVFDVEATAGAGAYGGMYMNGTNTASWPFYGYATDGAARAWHYVDGSTNTWHLNNGSVNRISVTNTGFVGIGIATPTRAILEQYGQVGTTNAIFGGGSTGISLMNAFPGIGFNWYQNAGSKAIAAGFGGYLYFDHTLGDFNFNVSSASAASANATHTNNTRLTLKNNGRVGIGTTAPSSLLDVNGQLTLNADNNWGSGGIRFRNSLNALDGAIVQSVTGGLYYRAPSGDSQLGHRFLSGAATTEIMTLLNNGRLGIGTTAPANVLDVEGGVAIGATYSGTNAAPTNGLLVQGNVGIAAATLNPAARLTVNGAILSSDANDFMVTDGDAFQFSHVNAGGTVFTERVRINSLGNVGLGTPSPNNRLDVEGGAVIGATYSGGTTAPTNGLLVEGNVGIGATAPASPLSVFTSSNERAVNIEQDYSGTAVQYGMTVDMTSATGTSSKYGVDVNVTGTASSTGTLYGLETDVNPGSGNSTVYGVNSTIGSQGTGGRFGIYSSVGYGSTNTSDVYGIFSTVGTAGTGTAFGIYSSGGDLNYFSAGVSIGTTFPTAGVKFTVVGTAEKTGGGSWLTFSDKRLKKDIDTFHDGLSVLKGIKPVKYKYNGLAGYDDDGQEYVGVLAQDVGKVAPYMISKVNKKLNESDLTETELLMYDATALPYILVNSIKEQQTQIEELQNTITALKRQLAETQSLSAQVQDLKQQLGQVQQLSAQVEELKKMVTQQAANSTAVGNDKK